MAPRGGRRSEVVDDGAPIHDLGIRGRKTGVFLKDTGERDEHGMQPLEDLLSSPEKVQPMGPSDDESDDQGSEDMDIETSIGPGPRTLLKDRSVHHPIPRSRSPIKTMLQSPARRNPRLSSPSTQDKEQSRNPKVTRKLDFHNKPQLSSKGKSVANGANDDISDDGDETEDAAEPEIDDVELLESSMQMVADMGDGTTSPEPQPESSPEPEVPVRSAPVRARGRPPKNKPVVRDTPEEPTVEEAEPEPEPELEPEPEPEPETVEPPPKKKSGRPKKGQDPPQQSEPGPSSRKRAAPRQEVEPDNDEGESAQRESSSNKRQRTGTKSTETTKAAPPKAVAKPSNSRGRPGRPRKAQSGEADEEAGDASFAVLQRGPPMPKSRGLVSVRRDADTVSTTRSGRHSYRPLDWWRGEQVVQEEEEFSALNRDRFVLPTVKEIIRVPQEETISKRSTKGRPRGKTQSKRAQRIEEEELEEWEINPGTVTGEVILWEPEHELHPPADDEPVEVMEDRVAISSEAIQTREIRDATFRFAKTLTTPFMGAGVVDLPPGAEKRPKNSRKMHMVFFVHTGKVLVTVNEAQFRITAGGMWFVPRGNYYSITNDYDNPARIFFSQGCEVSAQPTDGEQSQQSILA